LSAKHNFYSG